MKMRLVQLPFQGPIYPSKLTLCHPSDMNFQNVFVFHHKMYLSQIANYICLNL